MAEILLGKEYIFYIARPTQASLGYPAPLKGREFGEHPIKQPLRRTRFFILPFFHRGLLLCLCYCVFATVSGQIIRGCGISRNPCSFYVWLLRRKILVAVRGVEPRTRGL